MSSSRENSPDWLRCFQAPTQSVLTLSSGSESTPNDSPLREDKKNEDELSPDRTSQFPEEVKDQTKPSSNKTLKSKSPAKRLKEEHSPVKKRKKIDKGNVGSEKAMKQEKSEKHIEAPINSVWALSSDSESPHPSPNREASKGKSPKKGLKTKDLVPTNKKRVNSEIKKEGTDGDMEVAEENIVEKLIETRFSSSRLPLMLSDKVSRSKALVECEGESIDLSGDVGAVGRVVVSDEMLLDLKGTIYKTTIVPSRTFCVVTFGQSEAKIEAIMNDFIQLKPQSNVYEAETMVEGTLDGFLFDSDDEADKVPKTVMDQIDHNGGNGEKANGKPKKKAEKTSGVLRKRAKAAGAKPPKKAKKKTQAPKKGKSKK